jgi:hypothetical protein
MDVIKFHQVMRAKYAEKVRRRRRYLRLLRIWILCSATLLVLVLSLALAYLRHAGKGRGEGVVTFWTAYSKRWAPGNLPVLVSGPPFVHSLLPLC